MKNKININDLYFGVVLMPLSYSSKEQRTKLKTYNLFDLSRVKWSVARWACMSPEERKTLIDNPLSFLFGDVWGRTEFEFVVCPWPYGDGEGVADNGQKVDTYEMYVKPNEKLLMDMVNSVSESSARTYMREYRKMFRGRK